MRYVAGMMAAVALLTGCTTEQAANVMDDMGRLRGAHAARGGVNLDNSKVGDWQINRCDQGPDGSLVLSGSGANELLTVRLNDPKGAVLRVPGGEVMRFNAEQCHIRTRPKDDAQQVTVDCTASGHEVIAGVTTLRCGG